MNRTILMLLSSHRSFDGHEGAGLRFNDFAVPFWAFTKAGLRVELASPCGGIVPTDPRSIPDADAGDLNAARAALRRSLAIRDVRAEDYDALFVADGYGALVDLAVDGDVKRIVGAFAASDRVVGSVGYGCAAFLDARRPGGDPFVARRRITTRSLDEEARPAPDSRASFDFRARLAYDGAELTFQAPRAAHVVVDDYLVTGQNGRSSTATAATMLAYLNAAMPTLASA